MGPTNDQNLNPLPPSDPQQTAQPVNEAQAYAEQDNSAHQESTEPAQSTPSAINPSSVYPTPKEHAGVNPLDQGLQKEWKPNTTLASRIPALRNYGIALILGSLLFMYINRGIWKFAHQSSAKTLGIVIYAILGVMLVSGIVILLSKSKPFILLCLDIVLGLSVLATVLSLISLNIITVLLTVTVIGSVLNIKQYVKRAA